MNDYQFKLVKIKGGFCRADAQHSHPETDEALIILDGKLALDFRDGKVEQSAGELFVIPKGVEHKPHAEDECSLLLVESRGTLNYVGGELTADQDL